MEQPPPSSSAPPPLPPISTAPPPSEHSPPRPISTTSSSSSSPSPSSSSSSLLPSSPNPNPNPKPPTLQQSQSQSQSQSQPSSSQIRPSPPFNRPWQQTSSSPFSHFSSITHHSTSPSPPFSSSNASTSVPPAQRGGMAIGVPAPPPTSFSSLNPPTSFGQQFGGLGRNTPESIPSTSTSITSQVRQPIQGMQGVGMMGSLGSSSSLRPSGITAPNPQRPVQSSLRPQTGLNSQSPAAQTFQGHGLLRVPSVGSPGSPSSNTSQNSQSHNQPWLSSGSQGKPPLPPPSYRPQMNPQSLQQRSHIPHQQHHTISSPPPQQQTSSSPQSQPPPVLHQPQEHYALPPSRIPQTITQQIVRGRGLGGQKLSSQAIAQPSSSTLQPSPFSRPAAIAETGESCNRILSKRSIHELVTQIDPSERLDPEVEDVLVDIADEFVESITAFGCSLAKHRKSNTLEAKDILLHLEKNWNMTLPGFGGDEIKCYKKPIGNDVHRERLAAIKKSIVASETASSKSFAGQSAKGHPAKATGLIIGSPNTKTREALNG